MSELKTAPLLRLARPSARKIQRESSENNRPNPWAVMPVKQNGEVDPFGYDGW
ncbi:hypothetical protein [Salicibibacter halophilus]|uniref:hypothetical protein n=1 Tax=Salicibibacter halophilus TaxID=2502791 RepID=UPI00135A696E|nr:hypothetical protein [Salicibibacter halophilus]